jgi:hypothetical protein
MTWLGGRVKWPFGDNGVAVAEMEVEPEIESVADEAPRLMMLAADASGLASFKLLSFADDDEAIEFIQRSFGDRSDTGLIAFWGTTDKPDVGLQTGAETGLEVMVMVRDDIRNDVVYPFSFNDMETAQEFVQHELHRGLNADHILIYWAMPVQLGMSADGTLGLFPKAAPTNADPETHEIIHAPVIDAPDNPESTADFLQSLSVSAPSEETFVSEESDPIEAMFIEEAPVGEPVEQIADTVEDKIVEFAGGGDETNQEPVAILDEPEGPGDAVAANNEEEIMEYHSIAADVPANDNADVTFTDAVSRPSQAVAVETAPRDLPGVERHARSDSDVYSANDELQRVLRVRRLEQSTEPFRGFQSPPGRF